MSASANGRQEIPPHDDKRYSDIFWASLYATLCSLAFTEIRVIWLRSSVLLVIQVVVLRLAYDATVAALASKSLIHVLPSSFGLALAVLWYAMNYHGWKNQNVWWWHASRLAFTQVTAPLPSDAFRDQVSQEPWGAIYRLAQMLVGLFVLAYSVFIGISVRVVSDSVAGGVAATAMSLVVAWAASWYARSRLTRLYRHGIA